MSQAPLPNSPMLPITNTGVTEIDAALNDLNNLENLDVTEHADVYTKIHHTLNNALTNIDN